MSCSFVANVEERVIKQIQTREEKFGKSPKTDRELMIIHGNCPWVVLRSGVDAPENDADRWRALDRDSDESIIVTNDWAKKTVLGGELQDRSDGAESARPQGIQTTLGTSIRDKSYRLTDYQGHRPIAGITDVTVTTKDTWGMIMEAVIKIKCWSRDDLDMLDRVYFKLGYTVLLEWGHTLYFKEDGTECTTPYQMISDEKFFEGGNYQDLDAEVLRRRKEDSNKEALLGTVTNFSFSLSKDGSYDCTLKMLSKGSVIRGLRLKGINQFALPCNDDINESEMLYENISVWHRIHQAFISFAEKGRNRTIESIDLSEETLENLQKLPKRSNMGKGNKHYFNGLEALLEATSEKEHRCFLFNPERLKGLQSFPVVAVPLKVKGLGRDGRNNKEFYISLRSLLYLVNHFNTEHKFQFNLWDTAEYVDPDETADIPYASLNPYVAVKPNQSGDFKIDSGDIKSLTDKEYFSEKKSHKILNIWINFDQFIYNVDAQLDGKVDDYLIYEALQSLLGNIQKVFGNINEFQIVADHKHGSSLFTVIDTKCIEAEDNPDDVPVIHVTGLNNTVTELIVQSEVSSDTANQMSVAAQAPKTYEDSSESADEPMIHWGENCENRWHLPDESTLIVDSSSEADREDYDKNKRKWKKRLRKAYESAKKGGMRGEKTGRKASSADKMRSQGEAVQSAGEELFMDLQLDGEAYFHESRAVEVVGPKKPNLEMGIIPVRVGLTMMGIGNLTIGNVFRIESGVMLEKYKSWAQIVTGIEHRITKSGWVTVLKTQYYPRYYGDLNRKSKQPTGYARQMQQSVSTNVANGTSSGYVGGRRYRDPEALAKTCNMYTAMTEYAGYTWGKSQGHCARYTYGWARAYALGKKAITEPDRTTWTGYAVPAVPAGGNARDASYRENLKSLGYREQSDKHGMSPAEITKYARNHCEEGDVLIYYQENDKEAYGHTQFNTGHGWVSDFPQASEWSNSGSKDNTNPKGYRMIHLKAPKRSQDWCSV